MLTNQDIHNLLILLSRVQLVGNEAEIFVNLLAKLREESEQNEHITNSAEP